MYQAILTTALSASKGSTLNLNGKYSYLSSLAFRLHSDSKAHLTTRESRDFHKSYCEGLDIDIDYERTIDSLVKSGVVRKDSSGISFSAKIQLLLFPCLVH